MTTFHMSVTKQEAVFLKAILAKHLDEYVEEIVKEETNRENIVRTMQDNRNAGLALLDKAKEVNRRASRVSATPYFTNLS